MHQPSRPPRSGDNVLRLCVSCKKSPIHFLSISRQQTRPPFFGGWGGAPFSLLTWLVSIAPPVYWTHSDWVSGTDIHSNKSICPGRDNYDEIWCDPFNQPLCASRGRPSTQCCPSVSTLDRKKGTVKENTHTHKDKFSHTHKHTLTLGGNRAINPVTPN